MPPNLPATRSAGYEVALAEARKAAFRFVRRKFELRSGRRGPVLSEHWERTKILMGKTKLPSVGGYETGVMGGQVNSACTVPLRAARVALPESAGAFDLAAHLTSEMKETYEEPSRLLLHEPEKCDIHDEPSLVDTWLAPEAETCDKCRARFLWRHDARRDIVPERRLEREVKNIRELADKRAGRPVPTPLPCARTKTGRDSEEWRKLLSRLDDCGMRRRRRRRMSIGPFLLKTTQETR